MVQELSLNPFPSGGVTRPGVKPSAYVPLVPQLGVVERIEELIRSVVRHKLTPVKDDKGVEILKGKPELVMVEGEYGYGKTLTLTALYFELKERKVKIKENGKERNIVSIPIYQPLHALISQPSELIDLLIERLIAESPEGIKKYLKEVKNRLEREIEETDELQKKIYTWKYLVDAAIRKGVDVVVIMLDELEESIEDYVRFKSSYKELFASLREFTDRQVGPVITILGITPEARDSIEEQKEAFLRRAVLLPLPGLTSPEELTQLAKAYDPNLETYVEKEAIETTYRLARGNPGVSLAILH